MKLILLLKTRYKPSANILLEKDSELQHGPSWWMPLQFAVCEFLPERSGGLCFAYGLHVDELATVAAFGELHRAVNEGIESVVFAHAYVQTGVVYSTALALEDVACFGILSAEDFHAQTFAFRFADVLRTTDAFFMCQSGLFFLSWG